jgi:hypothetical protein
MMLASSKITKLGDIPLGGRLLYRSKKDWRTAVISRVSEDSVTLSVASPTGYNYRLKRDSKLTVEFDGQFLFIRSVPAERWRENFSIYDRRW